MPVVRRPLERQPSVVAESPDPGARRLRQQLDLRAGLLDDQLAPHVLRGQPLPAGVDLGHVDLVVDVEVLEQVEQEQRHVRVGAQGDVRDRRQAGHARVDLAQVDLTGVGIEQVVDLEESPVALLGKASAEPLGHRAGDRPLAVGQHLGEDVVAAPPALVRRQLGIPDQRGHVRPDQRAVARDHGLDAHLQRRDPAHHLELLVVQVGGVAVPVRLRADEERGLARVAVGRLHDQIVAQPGCRPRAATSSS